MGAWGYGIFQNDDVLDWMSEWTETEAFGYIADTIEAVLGEDYVEVDLASNALGAIELLAAVQGKPGRGVQDNPGLTEELEEWLADHSGQGDHLLAKAIEAIGKIKHGSELQELWEETEDYGNWLGVVEDLERRLRP